MHSSSKKVTLKDVAEAAKVSRMTVSLALRNHPSLPKSTRYRIREVAERLGYRPDPNIGQLMEKIRGKKTHRLPNVIAYLTAHKRRDDWHNEPTQRMYYEGAKWRADELGYCLEEFWLREPGMTERRLSEIVRNRGIEGALIAPVPIAQELFLDFHWDYVSAVEIGYSLIKPALHRCCNHQFHSMMALMRNLQRAGYRKIGLAMRRDQDTRTHHNWRAGYLASLDLLDLSKTVPMLLPDSWSRSAFAKWLHKHHPDVIVTSGLDVALWLKALDIRVPGEIGLANIDLSPAMGDMTGIDQNSHDVGTAAFDLLVSLMRLNERGIPKLPRVLMLEGNYVQGSTTRKVG